MKRTPLKRKNSLKKSGQSLKKKTLKRGTKKIRSGHKTSDWIKAKRKIKENFAAIGLNYCEARYDGCLGASFLTLAHSLKRRNIHSEEKLHEVALLCTSCHNIVECMKESEMYEIINQLIKNRKGTNNA